MHIRAVMIGNGKMGNTIYQRPFHQKTRWVFTI